MTKGDDMMKDDDLDALFAVARREKPVADAAFLARVLGDAGAVAAERSEGAAVYTDGGAAQRGAPGPVGPGPWRLLGEILGGWRGGMALTASALAGVWIGLADPAGLDTVAGLVGSLSGEAVGSGASGDTFYDLLLEG